MYVVVLSNVLTTMGLCIMFQLGKGEGWGEKRKGVLL